MRGEADEEAIVTVNGNATFRFGRYFYGGDSVDNSASHVFKELAIEATDPEDPEYLEASTGRVFVAQSPEMFTYDADGNMLADGRVRYYWNAENRRVKAEELYAPPTRAPYTLTTPTTIVAAWCGRLSHAEAQRRRGLSTSGTAGTSSKKPPLIFQLFNLTAR